MSLQNLKEGIYCLKKKTQKYLLIAKVSSIF